MPLGISEEEYMAVAEAAHDIGLKIEIAGGLPIFELAPSTIHQEDLGEIFKSIRKEPRAERPVAVATSPSTSSSASPTAPIAVPLSRSSASAPLGFAPPSPSFRRRWWRPSRLLPL